MHYGIVRYVLGLILKIEAALLVLPVLIGLIYREKETIAFVIMAVSCLLVGALLTIRKPKKLVFYAREGLVIVALSWVIISIFGALPFVINRDIPRFTDALFETISGFTTTGASILPNVEELSHVSLFWRSFTHWVGGMGVIVFMLAILPMAGGYNAQLMRAESPGPSFGKIRPKVRETAAVLYKIYFGMTVAEIIILLISGMHWFDTLCISFGSAGTGGFGVRADSCGSYTLIQQTIITVFITLFGVNFNAYYILLLTKDKKAVFKSEEVRWYLLIIAGAIAAITLNIRSSFETLYLAFHHAAFQVASIITTTGFGTVDFDLWPEFSKGILVLLMFIGACAGSTGGGFKVSRVIILAKSIYRQLIQFIYPRSVSVIKLDGKTADEEIVTGVSTYLATYTFLFLASILLLTVDHRFDLITDFTAVTATFNNIGPGLAAVGPTRNFADMSTLSKYVLMFDMLAGRLELYPILMLFVPRIWKKN